MQPNQIQEIQDSALSGKSPAGYKSPISKLLLLSLEMTSGVWSRHVKTEITACGQQVQYYLYGSLTLISISKFVACKKKPAWKEGIGGLTLW